jgi:hypothetical protein
MLYNWYGMPLQPFHQQHTSYINAHELTCTTHTSATSAFGTFETVWNNQMRPVIVGHRPSHTFLVPSAHSPHRLHRKAGNGPVVTATYVQRRVTRSNTIVSNGLDQSQYTYRIVSYLSESVWIVWINDRAPRKPIEWYGSYFSELITVPHTDTCAHGHYGVEHILKRW